MSAHVLLNLLKELVKRDKLRGLPSILSLFRNEFNKFNNTGALEEQFITNSNLMSLDCGSVFVLYGIIMFQISGD